jgi:hypothetical protein
LSRIDRATQFLSSAVLSNATEVVCAWFVARAVKGELSNRRLATSRRDLLSRLFSKRGLSHVEPDHSSESALKVRRDTVDAVDTVDTASVQARLESDLLFATKVAHQDLGEKVALLCGGAMAMWFQARPETAAKLSVLILLELVSDVVKDYVYVARKIEVGRIRYNFRARTLLAVVVAAGAASSMMLAAVYVNCVVGDDISYALG